MKPKRFRVNAMMGETEKEVLDSLGGQTAGIAELVAHFLRTIKEYKAHKKSLSKDINKLREGNENY